MNDQTNVVPMQETAIVAPPATALAPAAFDFAPRSLTEAMELAKLLAASTIVPKDYIDRPGNVLVAIQMGGELGLKPMAAMQNIAVINGRPSLWGDAVLALCRSATDSAGNKILEGIEEVFDEASMTATCRVKRRGHPPKERSFSRVEAMKAGLLNKEIWKSYERRMLQMRARSWALRDEFTEVLRGMPVAEEVMDYAPERDVTPPPQPETTAAASRSDKVLAERHAARVKAACDAFDNARNDAELGLAVEKAQGLPDTARAAVAEHYRKAKARLAPKEPAPAEQPTEEAKPAEPAADAATAAAPEQTSAAPTFTAAEVSKAIAQATGPDEADAAADLIRFVEDVKAHETLTAEYQKKVNSFGKGKK